MKNILGFLLLVILALPSCKKDDQQLFSTSPDKRLNEALSVYQKNLTAASNGWKGYIYPKSGGVYSFYLKFNDSNRVVMLSSFDSASAVTLKESSYRLKALQQPSLLFDTYSYLHVLADPDPNVNSGTVGAGLQSDFEFYFDSSSADTINLVGRFNGSKATLIKANAQEETGFINGQLAAGFILNRLQTYFKRLTVGQNKVDFHIDPSTRKISLLDATGNLLDTLKSSRYFMTFNGIALTRPLVAGNQIITGFSGLNYNAATQAITCTANNVAATITNVSVPSKVDVTAPRRWWTSKANSDDYWFSVYGFHVNGTDNAYRLDTLTAADSSYYFLIYYPAFRPGNDLFAPIFLNPAGDSVKLVYGTAPRPPSYTSDGRAVFTNLGTYGTLPTSGGGAITMARLFNPRGYYFVQTTASSYDMVSALDEKSWIEWQ